MRRASCLIAVATCLLAVSSAAAKEKPQGPTIIKYADGTVVRKGADGSIETYNPDGSLKSVSGTESSSEPAAAEKSSAPASTPVAASAPKPATVKNLPNRNAGTRKINGVTVKVNTDGTVETYEPPESMGTIYPASGHSKKSTAHTHHAPAHK